MMTDVILPKMGDAMEEGRIVQWLKNVGDKVGPDDVVVEIETDKSNVEVPASASGYLQSITVGAGETVPVGTVIGTIGAEVPAQGAGNGQQAIGNRQEAASAEGSADKAPPQDLTGEGKAPVATTAPAQPVAAVSAPPASAQKSPISVSREQTSSWKPYESFVGAMPENLGGSASTVGEPIAYALVPSASYERVKVSPLARAMAQANNLDLAALRGSGPDGGIVKKDVEAALNGAMPNGAAPSMQDGSANLPGYGMPAAPTDKASGASDAVAPAKPSVAVTSNDGDTVQEYNAMRRTIAKRLLESKTTIPHFYVSTEIDMEALLKLREQVNANASETQPKVSVNDCLIKAVAVALAENPKINAVFSDNKRILRKAINVGFGVALEDGLIVPVVRNADTKSLRTVAKETKPLIDRARAGKLSPADYTGGTFTISNMGVLPFITEFAAIVNPGEGAILAVASTQTVPAVVDGQIVPRKRMNVTLSADHRVVDGADGANFLISLKRVIENPLEMLA